MSHHFSAEQRLEILRAADSTRAWHSLADQRVCLRCEKKFTGDEIAIVHDQRGRFLLHCPTPGCPSTVPDWFYPVTCGPAKVEATSGLKRTAEIDFLNW
ncbi:MAG: hypothetical protein DLM73_07850 [Chthoniobacterales bacterium]|nr:MAG: hypothetical protein DLM73_07850 [Chthoniobacterales bacterium]